MPKIGVLTPHFGSHRMNMKIVRGARNSCDEPAYAIVSGLSNCPAFSGLQFWVGVEIAEPD